VNKQQRKQRKAKQRNAKQAKYKKDLAARRALEERQRKAGLIRKDTLRFLPLEPDGSFDIPAA